MLAVTKPQQPVSAWLLDARRRSKEILDKLDAASQSYHRTLQYVAVKEDRWATMSHEIDELVAQIERLLPARVPVPKEAPTLQTQLKEVTLRDATIGVNALTLRIARDTLRHTPERPMGPEFIALEEVTLPPEEDVAVDLSTINLSTIPAEIPDVPLPEPEIQVHVLPTPDPLFDPDEEEEEDGPSLDEAAENPETWRHWIADRGLTVAEVTTAWATAGYVTSALVSATEPMLGSCYIPAIVGALLAPLGSKVAQTGSSALFGYLRHKAGVPKQTQVFQPTAGRPTAEQRRRIRSNSRKLGSFMWRNMTSLATAMGVAGSARSVTNAALGIVNFAQEPEVVGAAMNLGITLATTGITGVPWWAWRTARGLITSRLAITQASGWVARYLGWDKVGGKIGQFVQEWMEKNDLGKGKVFSWAMSENLKRQIREKFGEEAYQDFVETSWANIMNWTIREFANMAVKQGTDTMTKEMAKGMVQAYTDIKDGSALESATQTLQDAQNLASSATAQALTAGKSVSDAMQAGITKAWEAVVGPESVVAPQPTSPRLQALENQLMQMDEMTPANVDLVDEALAAGGVELTAGGAIMLRGPAESPEAEANRRAVMRARLRQGGLAGIREQIRARKEQEAEADAARAAAFRARREDPAYQKRQHDLRLLRAAAVKDAISKPLTQKMDEEIERDAVTKRALDRQLARKEITPEEYANEVKPLMTPEKKKNVLNDLTKKAMGFGGALVEGLGGIKINPQAATVMRIAGGAIGLARQTWVNRIVGADKTEIVFKDARTWERVASVGRLQSVFTRVSRQVVTHGDPSQAAKIGAAAGEAIGKIGIYSGGTAGQQVRQVWRFNREVYMALPDSAKQQVRDLLKSAAESGIAAAAAVAGETVAAAASVALNNFETATTSYTTGRNFILYASQVMGAMGYHDETTWMGYLGDGIAHLMRKSPDLVELQKEYLGMHEVDLGIVAGEFIRDRYIRRTGETTAQLSARMANQILFGTDVTEEDKGVARKSLEQLLITAFTTVDAGMQAAFSTRDPSSGEALPPPLIENPPTETLVEPTPIETPTEAPETPVEPAVQQPWYYLPPDIDFDLI